MKPQETKFKKSSGQKTQLEEKETEKATMQSETKD
jgi:hypothetical protein